MSKFKEFMRDNKQVRVGRKVVVTQSLTDENGFPLEWELNPLTTKENELIRELCFKEVAVAGQTNQYKTQFDHSLYLAKIVCKSIVYPNLNDVDLQNSYGVMSPEELLKEMVDCPLEYQALCDIVTSFNGYESLQEKVELAKK